MDNSAEIVEERTKNCRVKQLKAMNVFLLFSDNMMAYLIWVSKGLGNKVEPEDEDFERVAADTEQYNKAYDVFANILSNGNGRI